MPQMHISTYSLAETFDVGRDTGTQVSKMYTDPFAYNGALDRVVFTVSDDYEVPPRGLSPAAFFWATEWRPGANGVEAGTSNRSGCATTIQLART